MLTKPRCVQCRVTAKALDSHGIEYKTIDITENDAALGWALENDFRAVPVVIVGDFTTEGFDTWTGFRPDRITSLATRMNGGPQ